ncbi:hypothetical protein EDD11_008625 [Mortierella claussenii]|nr:hypothetical protein EDD11_008625 [Mortierella claussenii]
MWMQQVDACEAYFGYLDILDAAALELRKVKFIANVAITSVATVSLMSVTRNSVASVQDILARHHAAIAASNVSQPTSPPFRKQSLARHSERLSAGQARTVTMLTEQLQAAAAAAAAEKAVVNTTAVAAAPAAASAAPGPIPVLAPAPSITANSATAAASSPSVASTSSPAASSAPASPSTLCVSPTEPILPVETSTPTIEEEPADAEEEQNGRDEPLSSPVRPSPLSSPGTASPVIYSPLLRSASVAIPAKPTRRPPLSPFAENSSTDTIDTMGQTCVDMASPSDHQHQPQQASTPPESHHHPLLESPPQIKPPLPPKPARYRKVSELRSSEDLSMDEDSSDEDEDEPEPTEDHNRGQVLHRKTSSPNIAIPKPWRRPGPSVSVPASPSHSPTNIPSSYPSSHSDTRSFSHTHYSLLRNNSSGLIAIIPEGCVDPTNLVEAERINGDDEGELDQKTYGPSDHLPMIPISPLRTTHRSLVEKEKSWSSMLADTKIKIQELCTQSQQQEEADESSTDRRKCEDDLDIQVLQEDARKYTSQIGNIMATITKVRELLYRSAGITSILEFPPYLIAYQLTLVESAIFLEIPTAALLTHSAKTPHSSITASTDFFNYLTRMIEYSVLFPAEASGRAQIMNHWVKVAVKLHELENFQTLKAILCALCTPPIKRLKRTWSFLPRKSTNKIETLSDLMSEDRNYGKYREMMNSLWAGTIVPSPEVTSPTLSDSSSSVSGSRFDILSSWNSSEIKSKEAARRPMIPFLGTFIMDMTYLLAAVKKTNAPVAPAGTTASSSPLLTKVPATSSLREKNLTVNTSFSPQDDVRIQDLLLALTAYQSGPRYAPQPPRSYIKASTKSQHHFRAPSLSSALQMTTKYRNSSATAAAAAAERERQQFVFDDDDDDLLGGSGAGSGGIRSTQQLILHYLLTRPWAPERMVDELSMIREPSKNNSSNGTYGGSSSSIGSYSKNGASSTYAIASSGWSSAAGSISSWSGIGNSNTTTSSVHSHSSSTSFEPQASVGSSEGSRPTSMEEE